HSFEKMVKHCDYLKAHQNLSEAEAQKYLGTYWMVQMTQFQLEVGYELGHLTIRAGEQPKILMYPYSETEFAMTFTARVEFFTDTTTGGIRSMIFEQDGQGAYMSAHIDESVEKAFDAIKKKDYESASTDIAEAIAANPSFSILGSIQEFLSFRKSNTDALTRYKALEGSYLLNGRELTIEIQQGELRFFAAGNSYGMDAHTLLEFKPDHFIVLDNLGNYLQFERGPRGVKGVTYHEFKSDKTIFAEKIR
ncbi:MAG: hypothetical protein NWR72_20435, partial [Bacteroidia bacterium]|nr:hypothetical protein [Bacteroidia bacterium]